MKSSLLAALTEFQFHSGSIQTHPQSVQPSPYTRFNSTLVRFKPEEVVIKLGLGAQFQFHSGSIQTMRKLSRAIVWYRFNSTLVRFKLPAESTTLITVWVSIPLWFDSNPPLNQSSDLLTHVSIPLWFDSNRYLHSPNCILRAVSIPLWFDSNLPSAPRQRASSRGFNSTLVRFKRARRARRRTFLHVFQFHSGSIQTSTQRSTPFTYRGFNSTLVRFKPETNVPTRRP